MLVIVGSIIVIGCVLGGYVAHGGKIPILIQPTELLIIGGAAVGGLVIASSTTLLKAIGKQFAGIFKAHDPTKQEYLDLLMLLYELIKAAKGNPLSLEPHVENPEASAIFTKYPSVLKNHHAIHFIADTLKVQISSPVNPYDLDDLMSVDIKTVHDDELKAVAAVNRVSDAMPGLGIVAAVLGVVITMGKLSAGKEAIGQSVAAALVGTFLGILISYGFMQPMAAKMDAVIQLEGKYIEVIKAAILAYAKDCSPKVCVEFARRTIPLDFRPDFSEVDKATSQVKSAA